MPEKYQQFVIDLLDVHIDETIINEKAKKITDKANLLERKEKVNMLMKAITFMDLTSLGGADTSAVIEKLCEKALHPLGELKFIWPEPFHTAAISIYPLRVQNAISALQRSGVNHNIAVGTVGGGFPSGQYPLETRIGEIEYAVQSGVKDIDIVINRTLALENQWEDLYNELLLMRKAANSLCLKTILATGELSNLNNVYKASMVAMMAGTDFIKTSTGKEAVNATLPAGLVMCEAIKEYYKLTGRKVGFKPAGGIKTATEVLQWMTLVKEQLGDTWLNRDLFRIGSSSVLDDVVNTIKKHAEINEQNFIVL